MIQTAQSRMRELPVTEQVDQGRLMSMVDSHPKLDEAISGCVSASEYESHFLARCDCLTGLFNTDYVEVVYDREGTRIERIRVSEFAVTSTSFVIDRSSKRLCTEIGLKLTKHGIWSNVKRFGSIGVDVPIAAIWWKHENRFANVEYWFSDGARELNALFWFMRRLVLRSRPQLLGSWPYDLPVIRWFT